MLGGLIREYEFAAEGGFEGLCALQALHDGPVAGFLVDDVVAATEELKRAGIAILSGPFTFENGVAWVHFRGPDGNVYGLTQGQDLEPTE